MITLLMSVYAKEDPRALQEAMDSVRRQTVSPTEFLIIKDGPLTPALESVLEQYSDDPGLRILPLKENVGLARALNCGLAEATQPWIMRLDSDDVAVDRRVELQRKVIDEGGVDLFGGQIAEFFQDPRASVRQRRVPCAEEDIRAFSLRRNPFNHMTVCYRRDIALDVGGYPNIPFMEDYALWLTMISAGARVRNLPDTLVYARIGNGLMSRRGGLSYAASEWRLQRLMLGLRLKSLPRCALDGSLRSLVFLAPKVARATIYKLFLRGGGRS